MFGEKNRVVDITTLIGKSCKLTGNIITRESIRIDGHVVGNVTTENIASITETAMLEGDLRGGEVFISGKVKGNIVAAKSLELEKTANITGDITTAKLIIHSGASFNGNTRMGDHAKHGEEKKQPATKPDYLEDK
jgi:cytoskeletal protein CcmA (bactofilin family)